MLSPPPAPPAACPSLGHAGTCSSPRTSLHSTSEALGFSPPPGHCPSELWVALLNSLQGPLNRLPAPPCPPVLRGQPGSSSLNPVKPCLRALPHPTGPSLPTTLTPIPHLCSISCLEASAPGPQVLPLRALAAITAAPLQLPSLCNALPSVYHYQLECTFYASGLASHLSSHSPTTHTKHKQEAPGAEIL